MGKVLVPRGFEPKKNRTWILVANRAEACIYEGNPGKELRFLKRLSNPKSKLMLSELVSGRPGRSFSSARGSGIRHGYSQHSDYHEVVAAQFARRIGILLHREALNKAFDGLVILAEPHFLGMLNKELSAHVKKKLTKEIPREWHEGSDLDLAKYLQKKLA